MASAKRSLGQRAGGHQHRVASRSMSGAPRSRRTVIFGCSPPSPVTAGGEDLPVHCQRAAGRHAGGLGRLQQVAAQQLHFRLEQAGGRVRAARPSANWSRSARQSRRFYGRGKTCAGFCSYRSTGAAAAGQLQRGLAPRQAGADDTLTVHGLLRYGFGVIPALRTSCR